MKKKKQPSSPFQVLYDPYSSGDQNGLFHSYTNDKKAIISIDGKTYYRALQIIRFNRYGTKSELIALLDNRLGLKIGDTLIDDNDHHFTFKGFAMIRFSCDIPDWYRKASFVELSGDHEMIGHYFAKLS